MVICLPSHATETKVREEGYAKIVRDQNNFDTKNVRCGEVRRGVDEVLHSYCTVIGSRIFILHEDTGIVR